MSESNSLVKLFNDIMKGMDDDDEKKLQQFTPDGVPAMIAKPPMPEEVPMQVTPPMQESAQELKPIEQPVSSIEPPELLRRIPQYESRLDDPQAGIVQPDGRMGTHQMAAEVDPETGMMTAFPMITEMPDGTLKQFENKDEALAYNKSVNNVKAFSDPQEGIDYAKGGYKEGTALAPTEQQQFSQQFGDVPLMGEVPKVESKVAKVKKPPVKDPGFVEKALASAGLPSTDSMKRKASEELSRFGNAFSSPEAFGRQLASSFSLPGEVVKGAVKRGTDLTAATVEAVGDPVVRFGQGFAGTDVTGVEKGSFGRYYPEEQEVPAVESQSTIPTLDEPIKEQQVDVESIEKTTEAISDPKNSEAVSAVESSIIQNNVPAGSIDEDGDLTVTSVDTSGNQVKTKLKTPEEKQGFLSTLWDGVKDIIVNQVKDPANQKALFAYAVSRALGYDGVTLASEVLSNEWKVDAATAKHERELERLYGKENLAALKKQRENLTVDYSKPVTVFNPDSQENYTVFMTKDKQGFVFDDGGTEPFAISTLLQGGYSIGEGLDFADQQQVLSDLMEKDVKTYVDSITNELNQNEDIKPGVREGIVKNLNNASSPPVIRAAMTAFTNKYGRGTDFTTAEVQTMASNGINNYLRAVADGRAKGSKDLIGYMDYEQIKYDITDNGIPSSFFTISGEEDQEIGVNGWSRTNNVVNKVTNNINSRLGKGSYTNTDIYKVLADEFNKKQGDKEFMTFWSKASKNSAEDKAEALSPAMLWVQSITRQDVSPSYKAPSLTEVLDMLAERKG